MRTTSMPARPKAEALPEFGSFSPRWPRMCVALQRRIEFMLLAAIAVWLGAAIAFMV